MRQVLAAIGFLMVLAGAAHGDEPTKLMFVDTGNTGRSVSAEALANALIREKHLPVLVISRAVDLDPFIVTPEANAAELLRRRNIDVSAHRAAQVTANDVRHADVILVMTGKHKATVLAAYPEAAAKTFTISDYATGQSKDVVDAFGKPMEVYEQVLAQLDGYMPLVLEKAVRR
jgi:protein-tyrosine phosphatase